MGKIKIINQFEPETETIFFDENSFKNDFVLLSDNYSVADKEYLTIIQPEASDTILEFIGWGTDYFKVEQGGFLVGRNYYDAAREWNISVVDLAFPVHNAFGDVASLHITHEDMVDIYRKLDLINKDYPEPKKKQLLGWFHTHPNYLDVFMSGIDQGTQTQLFNNEKSVALVFNPNRKIWKSYRSGSCLDNRAELRGDQNLLSKYGKQGLLNQTIGLGESCYDKN